MLCSNSYCRLCIVSMALSRLSGVLVFLAITSIPIETTDTTRLTVPNTIAISSDKLNPGRGLILLFVVYLMQSLPIVRSFSYVHVRPFFSNNIEDFKSRLFLLFSNVGPPTYR